MKKPARVIEPAFSLLLMLLQSNPKKEKPEYKDDHYRFYSPDVLRFVFHFLQAKPDYEIYQ